MNLSVIRSDSSGNGYILTNGDESVIIELGCKWNEYTEFLAHNISNVKGCLVSHLHQDHCRSILNALNLGIKVYGNATVKAKWSDTNIMNQSGCKIGSFYVRPVLLFHDTECTGFILENHNCGRIFFGIDTGKIPYLFRNINHFLIEVNWDDDSMIESIIDGKFVQKYRLSETHLSFDRAIDFLKRNINPETRNIVFLHLSKTNSNYDKILSEAKKQLSFDNIFIAEKGLTINLEKDLF